MKIAIFILSMLIVGEAISQSIIHPNGNRNSITKVPAGQTIQYYDDGGLNGNYSTQTNSLITIYPSKTGESVSIQCNSININSDSRMYIFDGNHAGAPIIGYMDPHSTKPLTKIRVSDKYTAGATNLSGCLSIRFVNVNRRPALSGWDFTVSSAVLKVNNPVPTSQDCAGAIKVCSDSAITTKSLGSTFQELPGPHFWNSILNYGGDGENQSNWYKFEVATSGTIEFLIKPHKHTDFDWALWGPYGAHECPAWTTNMPYRTSAGDGNNSVTGVTGLKASAVDFHEGSSGDGFVAPINVNKGEHYVLMIDDWSGNHTTFDLNWNFLNGASLECAADEEPPIIPDTVLTELEIEAVEIIDCEGLNKMRSIAMITPENLTQLGGVEVQITGGTGPYIYKWSDNKGKQISSQSKLFGMRGGKYFLKVTDKDNCVFEETFRIEVQEEFKEVESGPKLEAELSTDQSFITVSYPGAFEFKIETLLNETVITGHAVDSDEVEITKLPPGTYRVSLIYKKIKQYVTFVKE